MRTIGFSLKLLFFAGLVYAGGCGSPESGQSLPFDFGRTDNAVYGRYGPARVDILPITTMTASRDSTGESTINVYACLLDSFDSQIKTPATFRFELFQYLQRSADPKGKRLYIWPDIELLEPAANNSHWQDFLRAYQFTLPLQQSRLAGEISILRVTCLCPSGKRLSADFRVPAAK
jgi:hypothetical protein